METGSQVQILSSRLLNPRNLSEIPGVFQFLGGCDRVGRHDSDPVPTRFRPGSGPMALGPLHAVSGGALLRLSSRHSDAGSLWGSLAGLTPLQCDPAVGSEGVAQPAGSVWGSLAGRTPHPSDPATGKKSGTATAGSLWGSLVGLTLHQSDPPRERGARCEVRGTRCDARNPSSELQPVLLD